MKNKYLTFILVFVTLFLVISYARKMDKTSEGIETLPTDNMEQPIDEATLTDTQHTYRNEKYDVTYVFPTSWFGPEVYEYENGFRFEIGTDKVYPYGTDLTQRIYTKDNNYYIVADFNIKPANVSDEEYKSTNYAHKQYELVSKLKDGKSTEDIRSMVTKVRDINMNGVYGVEYISNLSDTAQTEMTYAREVLLIDDKLNTVKITGIPSNVVVPDNDKKNWKKYFEELDKQNNEVFENFVDAVSFPGQAEKSVLYINTK